MKKITLQSRSCECCGGNNIDQVWQSQATIKNEDSLLVMGAGTSGETLR